MMKTKKAELRPDEHPAGSSEKPGKYAQWLKAQEREVEKSAKTIATESAVKNEICQLEEKLTYDRKLHRNLVKRLDCAG